MLNASDIGTRKSLLRLREVIRRGEKPLVAWVGAGCSLWAGLPSWKDLALNIRRHFYKYTARFDNAAAVAALSREDYPRVFEECRKADTAMYHAFLIEALSTSQISDTYKAFISYLLKLNPLLILTTNVDLLLERSVPDLVVLNQSDLERLPSLLTQPKALLGKVHGSVTSVESLIFTTSDYSALASNHAYLNAITSVFNSCSVLFFGYSVRDKYVLDLLKADGLNHQLFGNGPHFLVSSSERELDGVNVIRYSVERHREHLAATSVLTFVAQSKGFAAHARQAAASEAESKSILYLTTFFPPGQHKTSQTATIRNTDADFTASLTVGMGWRPGELPSDSRAFHDLLVGLICFDTVLLKLEALHALFSSIGHSIATTLVAEGAVRFVHTPDQLGVVFASEEAPIGSLGVIHIGNSSDASGPISAESIIRRTVIPREGRVTEAESLIALLVSSTESTPISDSAADAVRGALLMPRVSRLLGMSDALNPEQVPSWLKFPILRVGELVAAAEISRALKISSVKLPYGGQSLVTAAFDTALGALSTDEQAGYVLTRNLKANLSAVVENNPGILLDVLKFREKQASASLRAEVKANLLTNDFNAFSSSVDGGVRSHVSAVTLENAAREMQDLLKAPQLIAGAVWSESSVGDACTSRWRERSLEDLRVLMKKLSFGKKDPCLCGSGDIIADCCMRALNTSV